MGRARAVQLLGLRLALALLAAAPAAAQSGSAEDAALLLAFKDSFVTAGYELNWTGADPCNAWDGVECKKGRVVSM